MMTILTSVKWYLIVVLIYISLMASDAEHTYLLMPLGPTYVLLGEVSVQSFSHYLTGLLVFLERSCVSTLYILEIIPLSEVSFATIFSHMVLLFLFC